MPQWQAVFSLSVRIPTVRHRKIVEDVCRHILESGFVIREVRNEGVVPFSRMIAGMGKDRVPHSHGRFIYVLFWSNDTWPVTTLRSEVLAAKAYDDEILTKVVRPFRGGFYLLDEFVHPFEVERTQGLSDLYPSLRQFRGRTNAPFEEALRESYEIMKSEDSSQHAEPRNLFGHMPRLGETDATRQMRRENALLTEALGIELSADPAVPSKGPLEGLEPRATSALQSGMGLDTPTRTSPGQSRAEMQGMAPDAADLDSTRTRAMYNDPSRARRVATFGPSAEGFDSAT
eukprot:TRINITY_DN4443_c0_g1_i1.p1 TRINITY_DN4443_c0_g1~~TRINITY_DN4443_c0_g1_i1.p1  ORF type:complete len:288 (-),score=38.11 TRINITY_DN4443_c0_g1_i1:183-1046(-)